MRRWFDDAATTASALLAGCRASAGGRAARSTRELELSTGGDLKVNQGRNRRMSAGCSETGPETMGPRIVTSWCRNQSAGPIEDPAGTSCRRGLQFAFRSTSGGSTSSWTRPGRSTRNRPLVPPLAARMEGIRGGLGHGLPCEVRGRGAPPRSRRTRRRIDAGMPIGDAGATKDRPTSRNGVLRRGPIGSADAGIRRTRIDTEAIRERFAPPRR